MRAQRFTLVIVVAAVLTWPAVQSAARGPKPPIVFLYPNVVEEIPDHLQIQNDHQREWLRFSTTHINLGPGNLQLRGGGQIAPCTIDGVAYDQCTFTTQEILDAAGN